MLFYDAVKYKTITAAQRNNILAEMKLASTTSSNTFNPAWAEQLLAAFSTELNGESPGGFLSTLDILLGQVIIAGGDVTPW